MEFRILGPLEVLDGGLLLQLGGSKQRAVLAVLLLSPNEVVSRDRLIDGVWGESPPTTAGHTLETYMSRLRGVLHRNGDRPRLLGRPHGYLLRVEDEELDVHRFEFLLAEGRRALAGGSDRSASALLGEALALFRGVPLEDLAHAPFIQEERARLDELKLSAIEERVEADLGLGRHVQVAGELQGLVGRYPFRERFWAQLMLSLYRSGRQAEALAAFDRVRGGLAEDLGVDPGPSLQALYRSILLQDAALEPNSMAADADVESLARADGGERPQAEGLHASPDVERSSSRRGRRGTALVAVVLLVALAAILAPGVFNRAETNLRSGFSPGLAIVDARTGQQQASIDRSIADEGGFTYADGHFWAFVDHPGQFIEIDPRSGAIVRRIGLSSETYAFAVHGNDLWEVGNTTLAKIDIRVGEEIARYPLPRDPDWPAGQTGAAVADGSLWVTRAGLNEVLRVDPQTGRVIRRYLGVPGPAVIAAAGGSAWTISHFSATTVVDLSTGAVVRTKVPLGPLQFVSAGGGYGWVSDEAKGVVYKVDPAGNIAATYHTGQGARPMSFSDGVLWVANQDVGTVTGIDSVTGASHTLRFGHPIADIAAGRGRMLVGLGPGKTYEDRIDALRGKVAKLFVQLYQLSYLDPALDSTWLAYQVDYATCAKLMNYPDAGGPAGTMLQPEVAASMPTLSADGRTYTFTIRPGYRFSPPSNQPLTAETFRFSIERALSPDMGSTVLGPRFIDDIAGESAFRAGDAEHISGLAAHGDQLTVTLVKPSPDFLVRLALPEFCPVPLGSPVGVIEGGLSMVTANHQRAVSSAGPYYIADANAGEYAILERNPNYTGPRPQVLDAIALREGIDPGQAVGRVESGSWDGVMNFYDPSLDPTGAIAQTLGEGSQAAMDGDQGYYAVPMPGVEALAFNASRPPFSDPDIRLAVALALDRSALAGPSVVPNDLGAFTIPEVASAQLLPPAQPGYARGSDPLPIGISDLAQARALMGGRHLTANLAVASNCDACMQWAEGVRHQLAPVGLTVEIKEMDDPTTAVRRPDARFDMFEASTTQDYADPATFLTTMFGEDVPLSWLPATVRSEIANLESMTGGARISAAEDLARRLAAKQVPATGLAYRVNGQFLSPRLGCRLFPSFGYGVDLAALCLNSP